MNALQNTLTPLPVVVPLLGAATLSALRPWLSRRAMDLLAILIAALDVVICFFLLREANTHTVVYWFGNWFPRGSMVVGIGFVVDPTAAALALLAAVLFLLAFIFSWRFADAGERHFHTLMLVFLAVGSGSVGGTVAMGGFLTYLLAHAFIKASLFFCADITLHRLRSMSEQLLWQRKRVLRWTGVLWFAGGLGLAGLPPFGTWLGEAMAAAAAKQTGTPASRPSSSSAKPSACSSTSFSAAKSFSAANTQPGCPSPPSSLLCARLLCARQILTPIPNQTAPWSPLPVDPKGDRKRPKRNRNPSRPLASEPPRGFQPCFLLPALPAKSAAQPQSISSRRASSCAPWYATRPRQRPGQTRAWNSSKASGRTPQP